METEIKLKSPALVREHLSDKSAYWDNILLNGKSIGVIEWDDQSGSFLAIPCLFFISGVEFNIGEEKEFTDKDDAVNWVMKCFAVFLSQFLL